jgi:pyoverdine/dityrosine biosynthesis protein Dit1
MDELKITVNLDAMTFGDLLMLDNWQGATWAARIAFLQRVVASPDILTLPVTQLDAVFEALKAEQTRRANPANLP